MTFSMNGRFTCSPGSRMTRRGWPNCRTSASSVCPTKNSHLIARTPATMSTTATTARIRRFTVPSSLPPQRRHSQRRRLRRAGGRAAPPRAAPRSASRRRCIARPGPESRKRQIRQDPVPALGRFVDDHLVAVLQDLFHRFQVEALERDFVSRLEGVVDREETIGVALRASRDLLPVGVRLLLDPNRIAARPRDDVVTVGFCFVAQPLAVGERPLNVAERVDDRSRRIDLEQLHLGELDSGIIDVEDSLQQGLRIGFDLAAALRQRLGDRGLADHFAHGALGGGFDRRLGIPDVEKIRLGVLDDAKDSEVDVDDVLVAGQHQRLFRHLAGDLAAARALGVAIADLGPVDAGHARPEDRLYRGRQVIVETRLCRPIVRAEPQNDADLIGQNTIEAARQPDDEDAEHDDGDAGACSKAAWQHAPEAVLATPQQLLETGRLRPPPARSRSPAAAAVAAPGSAAARTVAPWATATALTFPEHRP